MNRLLTHLVFVAIVGLWAPTVWAQSVALGVKSRTIYADVPFVLQVTASDFDDSPDPVVDDFKIPGATVTFLGMSPSVMSRRSFSNGRLSETREVRFIYSYRVEVAKAGRYEIPAIQVAQGKTSAQSEVGQFEASTIDESNAMRVAIRVPNRAVWVGEGIEAHVDLLLRTSPKDLSFVIPLFDHPSFDVEAPEIAGADILEFQAGGKDIQLPYQTSEVMEAGTKFTRFQFTAIVTPTKVGRYELDAPRVVAKLSTGSGRDAFGFRQSRYSLFKSTGKKTSFEVKGLPASGKPASFSGAVGANFSIQVSTSRSVVSVGEPIELSVVLGAERGLEGLSLPPMIGDGSLDKKLFDVIGNAETGQMAEDGRSKTFNVTVVLKSAEAREIPPIEFSFFDPERGQYRLVKSQPIALNVDGAAIVGAQDVMSNKKVAEKPDANEKGAKSGEAFLGDLTPSAGEQTLRTVASVSSISAWLWALYAGPLLLFAMVLWLRRTGDERGRSTELRAALKKIERAANRAKSEKAEASVGPLVRSIREMARTTSRRPGEWMSELENLAFDPTRRDLAVDGALVDQAVADARLWYREAKAQKGERPSRVLSVMLLIAWLAGSSVAEARPTGELDAVRSAYLEALEIGEREERMRRFEASERNYAALVDKYPGRPELLADWGNAALGAGNLGTAALAYRRSLQLDEGMARAAKNLQWIRNQMPSYLVPESDSSAMNSLFFWHSDWSLATRHLMAALSFMGCLFLLLPVGRYQVMRRRIAILPGLLFVATLASALLEPAHEGEAVVVDDGQILRSADSVGAPPALAEAIPAGLEVTLEEQRGSWTQVTLSNGTVGWLASHAVVSVNQQ